MLFKLVKQIKNDGSRVHVILFRDHIQDGRLAAILLLERVPNPFSDVHGPTLFKLRTSTVHNGVHVLLTLFCDLNKDNQLEDWWPLVVIHKYGPALQLLQQND